MDDFATAADRLVLRAMSRIGETRNWPVSTYRVQLHSGFTFREAAAIVPYLAELSITHLYASPYLRAQTGSTHGYDVIDHGRLNPELGSEEDFQAMVTALRKHGMSHVLDIVPNHMGIGNNDNAWWNDVLQNGPASPYANFFDINWNPPHISDMAGRVLIPCLGSAYGEVLEKGELKLIFENDSFYVTYYDRRFPISPRTYNQILTADPPWPVNDIASQNLIQGIVADCEALPDRCHGADGTTERQAAIARIKNRLAAAVRDDAVRQRIDVSLHSLNGQIGDASSFDGLDRLLREQYFRLASWRTAPDEINYRRFFDVNNLASLTMERADVFEASHALVFQLLAKGYVTGLRVDHPDGLYDPKQYFARLQAHYVLAVAMDIAQADANFNRINRGALRSAVEKRLECNLPSSDRGPERWPLYVLGEKILAADENLPRGWATQGTSGYDVLNVINGIFVDAENGPAFAALYSKLTGVENSYEELTYKNKKLIMEIALASELHQLALRLHDVAQRSRLSIDITLSVLKDAIKETIACFGVYRTYIIEQAVDAPDRQAIETAIDLAMRRNPKVDPSVFHFLRGTLLLKFDDRLSADGRSAQRRFAGKFQQLTSPVTAKGVEDTTFYIYNRLLSLNEVGGEPSRFGCTPAAAHSFFQTHCRDWPRSMATLSTHDTKRSEDVRARLNMLSEIPGEWREHLKHWFALNARHRTMIDGQPAPDRNDEYAIYQTLLGGWPLEPYTAGEFAHFVERVQAAVLKGLRESKTHTAWTNHNVPYEKAVDRFINAVTSESEAEEFVKHFRPFQQRISRHGAIKSLSQAILKLTATGVADTYQGTEIFDFSFVDPDNRRTVDYDRRRSLLMHANQIFTLPANALETGPALKLAVHKVLLNIRRLHPLLFLEGDYIPLELTGEHSRDAFAFARSHGNLFLIVAVPRLTNRFDILNEHLPATNSAGWQDTRIILPAELGVAGIRDVFTGEQVVPKSIGKETVLVAAELFSTKPFSVCLKTP